jgi:hypothetical protein
VATITWSASTLAPVFVVTLTPPARRATRAILVLVDGHVALVADAGEAADELRGIHEDGTVWLAEQARLPDGGVDLGPDLVAIEERELLAPLGRLVDPRAELVDLVRLVGDRQVAGLLEVAVDPVLPGERDQLGEVAKALVLERRELVAEVEDPVRETVGERRLAEAAIPAARPEPDRLGLEDDDAQPRIRVGQRDRGPEPGEPGPDDRDVGPFARARFQRGMVRPGRRRGQPVADRGGRVVRIAHVRDRRSKG